MSARSVSTVTRTVTVSDLTPAEMASIFAGWCDDTQAAFFAALRAESADWPCGGWSGQAYYIVQKSNPDARFILGELAEHYMDAAK